METFRRNLYEANLESEHIAPYLDEIERLHAALAIFPDSVTFPHLVEAAMAERAGIAPTGDPQQILIGTLAQNILALLQFFLFSHVFKLRNLLESLLVTYNSRLYLAWSLLARSVVEHCATFYYFKWKLDEAAVVGDRFTRAQLDTIYSILREYSHGTRYDWPKVFAEPRLKTSQIVNVQTAVKHLGKSGPPFRDIPEVYQQLSDFCHPNLGSHWLVDDSPTQRAEHEPIPVTGLIALARVPQRAGEFVMVITLPAVTACFQRAVDLIAEVAQWREHWVDQIVGRGGLLD